MMFKAPKSWLRKTISIFELRVVGSLGNYYDLIYDNFRIGTLLRSGTLLPCDKKIAFHLKIASKVFIIQVFLARFYLLFGWFFLPFYLLSELFTILSANIFKVKEFPLWFVIITLVPSFFLLIFLLFGLVYLKKLKNNNTLSLIIASLVEIMEYLFNQTDTEHLWDKALANEVINQQITKILTEHETGLDEQELNRIINEQRELRKKKKALLEIEKCAKFIEYYLPHQLRSRDIITDEWFHSSMQQV